MLIMLAGLYCVNHAELLSLSTDSTKNSFHYSIGIGLAVAALACWTWYPMRNSNWLQNNPERSPRAWATAQGLMTLPLALIGYLFFWVWTATTHDAFEMPFGPRPAYFIGLMVAIGLFASWLGTSCWNEASQRLSTAMVGQLIVFETLAALAYAYMLRGEWPEPVTFLGVSLLLAGVLWAAKIKPVYGAVAH